MERNYLCWLWFTDISGEDKTNKQNDLTADVTNLKYPTVTAVNDGFINSINSSIYAWGDESNFWDWFNYREWDYPSILSTLVSGRSLQQKAFRRNFNTNKR
jgi:hypothetical protein